MPDLTHTKAYAAVQGAVHNVLHGHPDWTIPHAFAQSVAKRAAGTLLSLTRDGSTMLAAPSRSKQRRPYQRGSHSGGGVAMLERHRLIRAHQAVTVTPLTFACLQNAAQSNFRTASNQVNGGDTITGIPIEITWKTDAGT